MLAHFAAVRSQLVASLPAAVTVEDTVMLNTDGSLKRGQYVLLLGGGPDVLDDGRLAAPQSANSDAEYVYTARCVSVTADGVRGLMQKVLDGVVGFRPVIPGRNCQPISLDDSTPVQPQGNLIPPLFFADLDLLLISSRA